MSCPRGSVGEPPSLDSSGLVFLCLGPGWRRLPGRSQGRGRNVGVDQEHVGFVVDDMMYHGYYKYCLHPAGNED
jgi:hypothetical protein